MTTRFPRAIPAAPLVVFAPNVVPCGAEAFCMVIIPGICAERNAPVKRRETRVEIMSFIFKFVLCWAKLKIYKSFFGVKPEL
jgi:hypothetical protein